MNERKCLQLHAGAISLTVDQADVSQLLMDPIIARLPSENPLIYGVLYDEKELIPLFDLSQGSLAWDEAFGKLCILLRRGTQKLAVALSGITEAPSGQPETETEGEQPDLFRQIAQELARKDIGES